MPIANNIAPSQQNQSVWEHIAALEARADMAEKAMMIMKRDQRGLQNQFEHQSQLLAHKGMKVDLLEDLVKYPLHRIGTLQEMETRAHKWDSRVQVLELRSGIGVNIDSFGPGGAQFTSQGVVTREMLHALGWYHAGEHKPANWCAGSDLLAVENIKVGDVCVADMYGHLRRRGSLQDVCDEVGKKFNERYGKPVAKAYEPIQDNVRYTAGVPMTAEQRREWDVREDAAKKVLDELVVGSKQSALQPMRGPNLPEEIRQAGEKVREACGGRVDINPGSLEAQAIADELTPQMRRKIMEATDRVLHGASPSDQGQGEAPDLPKDTRAPLLFP